ncbi:MAG TPA: TIGR03435 family protein [Bryobacteraceae bacterium]|nr:TIGR03435 family protein [Bryobacteraceae bacterium]
MRGLISSLLLCGAAVAQSGTAAHFIVASVHPSPRTALPATKGPFFGDGRYEIHYATMVDLIHAAYNVDPELVYGGPSWLEYDRYDVLAMAPPNSTAEARRLMLQSLLAARFGLVLHKDSKPMTAYVLKAGASPKLQESSGGSGCNFKIENMPPPGPPPAPGEGRPAIKLPTLAYTCQGTTMANLAETVANAPGANGYFENKPVVDQTGLKGSYDFTFRYTPKVPANIKVEGETIPIFDAMEKQLGLKLELSTAPMPVISVDSANETPSADPPDAQKAFPPIPTEFDAAEIKPSDSKRDGNVMPEIKNGRVLLPGMDLKTLVLIAWDFNPNDDSALVNAPKWLNTARYDIIAKAPAGVALGDLTPRSNKQFPVNLDALVPMLRNLLIERFKLQVHMEERPMNAFTLLAVKPKMLKADPATRTKWVNGALGDQKETRSSNPALGRYVSCQNMTMAQFAKLLQEIAPGYVHNDVLDATGLEGGWTFTLNFSGAGEFRGGGRGDGGGAASAGPSLQGASDPSGALSLPDAISKQLGLKLEQQKRPVQVLVIDHIEEKPVDN